MFAKAGAFTTTGHTLWEYETDGFEFTLEEKDAKSSVAPFDPIMEPDKPNGILRNSGALC
jgi:hypothetical protein